MNVKELIEMLESVPEDFRDCPVYLDDYTVANVFLDTEHGEFNVYSNRHSTTVPVDASVLVSLLSTSHPNGKFMFDYRGVSSDKLEDVFYQALNKVAKKK